MGAKRDKWQVGACFRVPPIYIATARHYLRGGTMTTAARFDKRCLHPYTLCSCSTQSGRTQMIYREKNGLPQRITATRGTHAIARKLMPGSVTDWIPVRQAN